MLVGEKFTLVKSLPENCCFSLEKCLFRLRDKKMLRPYPGTSKLKFKN